MPARKGQRNPLSNHDSQVASRSESIRSYADHLAGRSKRISCLHVRNTDGEVSLLRYRWADSERSPAYRVGIFAGIHGDEHSGVIAATQLLQELDREPVFAEFYELHIYPVCNPWGFDYGRREGSSGKDLNRCFWGVHEEPEVRLLEQDLRAKQFDGIIALHTDDTSEGIYGYANGSTLTRHLLEPALHTASRVIPRDIRPEIDSHPATGSIISGGYSGILGAPAEQHPQPFSIVFETPHHPSIGLQVEAHLVAIREILRLYREISSEGRDI